MIAGVNIHESINRVRGREGSTHLDKCFSVIVFLVQLSRCARSAVRSITTHELYLWKIYTINQKLLVLCVLILCPELCSDFCPTTSSGP